MPNIPPGSPEEASSPTAAAVEASVAAVEALPELTETRPPWTALRVAVIDDAMHPPRLDRLEETERVAVEELLTSNSEVLADLTALGVTLEATADERFRAIAEADTLMASAARVGDVSTDALRMIEEHQTFRAILRRLENEVAEVRVYDPFQAVPTLTAYNLILLDYYLHGPASGGDLAIQVAKTIRGQQGRLEDQQIVLMSSRESVRDLRGEFRMKTDVAGSAFAFVAKRDLNESWKIKAHLGMLERARPYAPAFVRYRGGLEAALARAKEGLLNLVDDLDIGDYAFLQSHALMKDGHPLGEYVFWLLSSQLMALGFEGDEMRIRQRELDALEFVGEPFASTEPSTVVAKLLHSALVSRNVGPLGPHPRAEAAGKYAAFPLVQLGDVFLNLTRTKAIVVMSADCDLAFAPVPDREPDADRPVMLVPGTPIKLRETSDEQKAKTDGILHREEVYRIVWEFAKYRSVPLGELDSWLKAREFDVSNRDRLRPLFGLKLQQEFGAHLLRVGPPIMPPMTTPAYGKVFICIQTREEFSQLGPTELMLTRFKNTALLRMTTKIASVLKLACENLLIRLEETAEAAAEKEKLNWNKKVGALNAQINDDQFWINLLNPIVLNAAGSLKTQGHLQFILGTEWPDAAKPRVVLEIVEDVGHAHIGSLSGDAPALVDGEPEAGAISAA